MNERVWLGNVGKGLELDCHGRKVKKNSHGK
jgi:hypothetical protein